MKELLIAVSLLFTLACSGVSPLAPMMTPIPPSCQIVVDGYLRISADPANNCEDGSPYIEGATCLGIVQPVGEWQMIKIYEHHNAFGAWCVEEIDLTAYYAEMDCPVPSFCGGGTGGYAILGYQVREFPR